MIKINSGNVSIEMEIEDFEQLNEKKLLMDLLSMAADMEELLPQNHGYELIEFNSIEDTLNELFSGRYNSDECDCDECDSDDSDDYEEDDESEDEGQEIDENDIVNKWYNILWDE
jgi:hypothetical protein